MYYLISSMVDILHLKLKDENINRATLSMNPLMQHSE